MLEHGGKLIQAAHRYNIPVEDWLDLSTGLNPRAWPASRVPIDSWSRLPEDDDGLLQAAHAYYGSAQLLPVAGSQAAIQALPRLRKHPSRVAILDPAYAEHAYAWQTDNFSVTFFSSSNIEEVSKDHDVIVLINPNNPTGECFSIEQCLHWQSQLQQRGGWLVIDEAFIDSTPENSLVTYAHLDGLIVLRSLGKFFGLAGARVGFVFAESTLLTQLAEILGPWPISGPSRCIAKLALLDTKWHTETSEYLKRQGSRLQQLLYAQGLTPCGSSTLFQWVKTENACTIHEQLASNGILTRLFHHPASLRFGLPGTEQQWLRLEQGLLALVIDNQTLYEQQS